MALTIHLRRNENRESSEHEFCFLPLSHQFQRGAPPALIEIKELAQERLAPVWSGTFVVGSPTIYEALSPFRSVPPSAKGRGHGEGTLDELIEFAPV
jgi:hypothetical protein